MRRRLIGARERAPIKPDKATPPCRFWTLRRLAGGDNLRKEHRTQVSREQVRVYPQGDRRVKVPQLAGDLDDRGADRDQQGRSMPDLMGVRDSRPAAFSNFRTSFASLR